MKKRKEVVCFLLRRNSESKKLQVLLGLKTKKTGQGRRNGYGGGQKFWETPEEAAIRELREELKVKVIDQNSLYKRGILKIYKKDYISKLTIFVIMEWFGEFSESDEMIDPLWFDIDNLPDLIDSDHNWLPDLLKGYDVKGKIKDKSSDIELNWRGWPI